MIKKITMVVLLAASIFIASCTPHYQPPTNNSTADIVFKNKNNVLKNYKISVARNAHSCGTTASIPFVQNYAQQPLSIPANQLVTIMILKKDSDSPGNCQNVFSFTPRANQRYQFNLTKQNGKCIYRLYRVATSGNGKTLIPVKYTPRRYRQTIMFGYKKISCDDQLSHS